MKVTVYDLRAFSREVELPDKCPKCGADIKEGAMLDCCQMTYEEQSCRIAKDEDAEFLDDWGLVVESFPEAQYVKGFKCGCGHELVMGEETEEQA